MPAPTTVRIDVHRLPEGVYLATSEDLPGLIVETATREEAIDLARDLALELVDLNGGPSHPDVLFRFPKAA